MSGDKKVLVYHYRHNDSPVVKDGLEVINKDKLTDILNKNEDLQSSTKEISSGEKHIGIRQHDLYTPAQKESFKLKPNYDSNVAEVTLSSEMVKAGFSELTILSHKRGDE